MLFLLAQFAFADPICSIEGYGETLEKLQAVEANSFDKDEVLVGKYFNGRTQMYIEYTLVPDIDPAVLYLVIRHTPRDQSSTSVIGINLGPDGTLRGYEKMPNHAMYCERMQRQTRDALTTLTFTLSGVPTEQ